MPWTATRPETEPAPGSDRTAWPGPAERDRRASALPGPTGMEAAVLKTAVDEIGDGVLLINRLRKIMAMNPAAARLTGWRQRDLTSITCGVLRCRDERGRPTCAERCLAQRCIETGQRIGPLCLRLSRSDGAPVLVAATFVPVRSLGSRAGAALLVLDDVTLLELLDATVRRLTEEIAEKKMVLRGFSDEMSQAWRVAALELRASAQALRTRHADQLGEAGLRTVERLHQASQTLEQLFVRLKARALDGLPDRAGRSADARKVG